MIRMIKYTCIALSCLSFFCAAQDNKKIVKQIVDNGKDAVNWNYSARALKTQNVNLITLVSFLPSHNLLALRCYHPHLVSNTWSHPGEPRKHPGVQIWNLETDNKIKSIHSLNLADNSHNDVLEYANLKMIFSQCHNFIIAHTRCEQIHIFNAESGKCIQKIDLANDIYYSTISTLAVSPSGNKFAFTVKNVLDLLQSNGKVNDISYSYTLWVCHDRLKMVEAELEKNCQHIFIKDIQKIISSYVADLFDDFEKLSDIDRDSEKIIYSPDGQNIAVASGNKITIFENGKITKSYADVDRIDSITFSSDSKDLIRGLSNGSIISSGKAQIFAGHDRSVNCVAFSQCGKFLISASYDKSIKVWDYQSGECIKDYQIGDNCHSIDVSLNGKYIACALQSGKIIVFTKET